MTWAHYLLQVNIYLVIFYAFYKLLLDKETYFMLNRIYLLSAGFLSLSIPFIQPEWLSQQTATQQVRVGIDQLNQIMTQVTLAPEQEQPFNWGQTIAAVYLSGLLLFSLRFIWQLLTVKKLIKAKPTGAAFSFFNKKVIDIQLPGLNTIHQHEEVHIRQLHTVDVLFFEILGILAWCNPITYAYKTAIRNLHEYLADEVAAGIQGDKESYAMLLLSKAFGIDQNVLTNNFSTQSLLKKRILMLNKQRSRKTAILKYGLFLPLFAVALLFSSATISRNEELIAVAEEIKTPQVLSISLDPSLASKEIAVDRDNWTPFYTYLAKSIRYPVAAHNSKLQGNTLVKFSIRKGEVNGITVTTPLGDGCDAEVIKRVAAFDGFKGMADGNYSIKVAFRLADLKGTIKNAQATASAGTVALKDIVVTGSYGSGVKFPLPKPYNFVDVTKAPSFKGGMEEFYKYLAKECKYPKVDQDKNISGKVFLSFIVEPNGKLSDIKVVKGVSPTLDAEAIRLIEKSPDWSPGYSGNTPVRVKYDIPISFSLSDDKKGNTMTIKSKNQNESHAINFNANSDDKVMIIGNNFGATSIVKADPIYILDGVKISNDDLKAVNPNEIASMNVLKGASATTLYGADGKNGVVQIITKKNSNQTIEKPVPVKASGTSNN